MAVFRMGHSLVPNSIVVNSDGLRMNPTDPDLWAALRGLEPRTRTALLLNVLDGYTQAEIGAMLGVPEGTVASWLSRGRSALRKELGPDR